LDERAIADLRAVFVSWEAINWRSLRSAVQSGGVWFIRSRQLEIDLNRDLARAYLDLVPFVWDEFFGTHLSDLTDTVGGGARDALHKAAERLTGAMGMLHHQQADIRGSMETSVRTAEESLHLQIGQTRAALDAHIQRTRQALSTGMIEAASDFMQPAYTQAAGYPIETGIKRRILDVLTQHAGRHAPALFINMRQDLVEGVTELQASMKPQLSRIVGYGEAILNQFQHNMTTHQVVTPAQRRGLEIVLSHLPQFGGSHSERLSQEGTLPIGAMNKASTHQRT
jgi:hypothetical protein